MSILKIRNAQGVFEEIPLVRGETGTKIILGTITKNIETQKYYLSATEPAGVVVRDIDYVLSVDPDTETSARLWKIVPAPEIIDVEPEEEEEGESGLIEMMPTAVVQLQGPQGPAGAPFAVSTVVTYSNLINPTSDIEKTLDKLSIGSFILIDCDEEHEHNEDCHFGEIFYKDATGTFKPLLSLRDLSIIHGRGIYEAGAIEYNSSISQYCATEVRVPMGRYLQKDDLVFAADGQLWRVTSAVAQFEVPETEGEETKQVIYQTIPVDNTGFNLRGPQGETGAQGTGIVDIQYDSQWTEETDFIQRYAISLSDGTTKHFYVYRGIQGIPGEQGAQGIPGATGPQGRGIKTITPVPNNSFPDTAPEGYKTNPLIKGYKIEFTDGVNSYYYVKDGNGIQGIQGPQTDNLTDTYTIMFTDPTAPNFAFDIKNGNGIKEITLREEDIEDVSQDIYDIVYTDEEKEPTSFTVHHGRGIVGIEKTNINELVDTYTITYNYGEPTTFEVHNGEKGDTGNGITNITGPETDELVDTYTINFDNGDTTEFTVTNGKSAYQVACDNGFEGTEEEWLASLKGEQGNQGEQGLTPFINDEGYWQIGDINTDVKAVNLALEKVDSIDDVKEPNVIYLIPVEGQDYYNEYLLYNDKPELIGTTEIPLSDYATLKYVQEEPKLYRHNIVIRVADANGYLENKNSTRGAALAALTIINDDPNSYAFDHTAAAKEGSGFEAQPMSKENAWQLLRLYRAISTSNKIVSVAQVQPNPSLVKMGLYVDRRPCSGSIVGRSATEKEGRGIVNTIWGGYVDYDSDTTVSARRVLCISGTSVLENSDLDGLCVKIYCGDATIEDMTETSLHKTLENFYKYEYHSQENNSENNKFYQDRMYCKDFVEALNPYTGVTIVK